MSDMVKLGRKFEGMDTASSNESFPNVYLEGKQITDLGLDAARVGSELTMIAKVRVASLSQYKGGEGSLSLELIEAKMTAVEAETDKSSVLFPNG